MQKTKDSSNRWSQSTPFIHSYPQINNQINFFKQKNLLLFFPENTKIQKTIQFTIYLIKFFLYNKKKN